MNFHASGESASSAIGTLDVSTSARRRLGRRFCQLQRGSSRRLSDSLKPGNRRVMAIDVWAANRGAST